MPTPDDGGPGAHDASTPPELRGLIDFLNSRPTARRAERFDTPANAAAFLARCELSYDGRQLSPRDTARLKQLRDALIRAVEQPNDRDVWEALNAAIQSTTVRLKTDTGPALKLVATATNPADAVIADILTQLTYATITGRWQRLGTCARCRRVFYDSTRSHTRRWCNYATCGNRANTAAFRSRQRAERTTKA
jgi:predicted RNA-binding Zn ribbon-like protein